MTHFSARAFRKAPFSRVVFFAFSTPNSPNSDAIFPLTQADFRPNSTNFSTLTKISAIFNKNLLS